MSPLVAALLVGVGGALGAMSRHLVGLYIASRWSVAVVNTIGSFALGVTVAAGAGPALTILVAVGFCGAFTTFSSVAVETVSTAADGKSRVATRFAVGTVLAAVAAYLFGSAIGTLLT